MRTEQTTGSFAARFVDAFFREGNIKWMLGLGMLILLGSSSMLVTSHWEGMVPVVRYLVLLGYTVGIFGASEICVHRLKLSRTGIGLQMLTVLLLPLTFGALRWTAVAGEGEGFGELLRGGAFLVLLGIDIAFAAFASRRCFASLLRGNQLTFLACYLFLCIAGAFVPRLAGPVAGHGMLAAIALAGLLWAVFAIGVVKVNRHIFWLVEEHRWPRVFGFFPILVLGAQFVALFGWSIAPHVSLQWTGLIAALVAIPVLLTGDAVADVFRRRTGDLVRPYPWHLLLPLAVGLVLCAAGLILSATNLPGKPFALVPTAALVAMVLGACAHRTGKTAFVWAMLACVLLAYNFSPVFFADLARAAVAKGAVAVHEPKLPFAFYGVTYLPLLVACAVAYRVMAMRGRDLFAVPLRRFSIGISLLLLVLSWTWTGTADEFAFKAATPVGLVMAAVFAGQVWLFRDRRLSVPACLALIAAACGLPQIVGGVWRLDVPENLQLLALCGTAAVLTWPGRWFDRITMRWSEVRTIVQGNRTALDSRRSDIEFGRTGWQRAEICRAIGMLLTLTLAACTLYPGTLAWTAAFSGTIGVLLTLLLLSHAFDRSLPGVAEAALMLPIVHALAHGLMAGFESTTLLACATVALAGLWIAAQVLERHPHSRLGNTFAAPARRVSTGGLLGILWLYVLPIPVIAVCIRSIVSLDISWVTVGIVTLWAFHAAARFRASWLSWLGSCATVAAICAEVSLQLDMPGAWEWLPLAATLSAMLLLAAGILCRRLTASFDEDSEPRAAANAVGIPLVQVGLAVLTAIAFGTLLIFTSPLRIAGVLAAAVLVAHAFSRRENGLRQLSAAAMNGQLIAFAAGLLIPGLHHFGDLFVASVAPAALPLALLAAVSAFVVDRIFVRRSTERTIVETHLLALRSLQVLLFGISLQLLPHAAAWQMACAAAACVMIVTDLLLQACRERDEYRVWWAEGIAAAAVVYFILFGVIVLGTGWSLYVVLVAAGTMWLASRLARKRESTAVLARPFELTALVLPGLTITLALSRGLHGEGAWLGSNSLALLFAAMFYFHQSWERGRKGFLVLAAAILNVALLLLWTELELTDPQFYMIPVGISILALVELLRREIPAGSITPLRYLGALVILVSPTLHIVAGSWLHMGTLMIASMAVVLAAIGLRAKPLVYTGTAFLVADVLALVVQSTIDHPQRLWVVGILLGMAVIALAAYCEKRRELVLQRIRLITAELEQWE